MEDKRLTLTETIQALGEAFDSFKEKYDQRIESLEKVVARGGILGGGDYTNSNSKENAMKALGAFAKGTMSIEAIQQKYHVQGSMSTSEDSKGGMMVEETLVPLIQDLALQASALFKYCRVVDIKGGELLVPTKVSEAESGWITEKGTRSETDSPELALVRIHAHELYSYLSTTNRLIDTASFDVAAWLVEAIGRSFAETIGEALVTGNGVSQPSGIIQSDKMVADASWEWGKTGYIKSGTADALDDVDALFDLADALPAQYRNSAMWFMRSSTMNVIRKFKDGAGNGYWAMPFDRGVQGAPPTLLGYPVVIDEHLPAIAADAYPIAFMSPQEAVTIVKNKEIRVIRNNVTEPGFTKFYAYRLLGAAITNYEAIKFLKIAA